MENLVDKSKSERTRSSSANCYLIIIINNYEWLPRTTRQLDSSTSSHEANHEPCEESLIVQLFRESRDLAVEPFNLLSISPNLELLLASA